jgi:glycerol uptake facilitator-like aquaporin
LDNPALIIGNGSIAQFILSKQANGTFPTVNIGYCIGLMIGAYMAGGVNPAVTLAMALRGKTSWIKVCGKLTPSVNSGTAGKAASTAQ